MNINIRDMPGGFPERTIFNASNSDFTIYLSGDPTSTGCRQTLSFSKASAVLMLQDMRDHPKQFHEQIRLAKEALNRVIQRLPMRPGGPVARVGV